MILNIKKALELYKMLKDFIPEYELTDSYLDFTGKIIHNINNSETPERFGESIILMTGISVKELSETKSVDVIRLFIDGLSENKFLSLLDFCKGLKI